MPVGATLYRTQFTAFFQNSLIAAITFLFIFFSTQAHAFEPQDIPVVGLAFLTNLSIHEVGHYIMADQAGAEGNSLNFFKREQGSFFFGLSTVTNIDDKAKPSYHLAGEVASSYTFEMALKRYRDMDSTYNRALMFFSMTDFLWYTTYAFYLSPHQNDKYDPIGISNTTGISRDTIFLVALTQSSLNAIRIYTRQDMFIPYFSIDKYFIGFNVRVPF